MIWKNPRTNENYMLQHKDPFLKTVADAYCILSGWKNKFGNRDTRLTEMMAYNLQQQAMRKKKQYEKRDNML